MSRMSTESLDEVCLIDEKLGFADLKNVYNCKKPLKCCVQYQAPSCCGAHSAFSIIKQQILLWGGLFAILLAIAGLFYCRNNDIQIPMLARFRDALARFCCGAPPEEIRRNKLDKELGLPMKTLKEDFEQPLRVTSSNATKQPQPSSSGHNGHSSRISGWRNNAIRPVNVYDQSQV